MLDHVSAGLQPEIPLWQSLDQALGRSLAAASKSGGLRAGSEAHSDSVAASAIDADMSAGKAAAAAATAEQQQPASKVASEFKDMLTAGTMIAAQTQLAAETARVTQSVSVQEADADQIPEAALPAVAAENAATPQPGVSAAGSTADGGGAHKLAVASSASTVVADSAEVAAPGAVGGKPQSWDAETVEEAVERIMGLDALGEIDQMSPAELEELKQGLFDQVTRDMGGVLTDKDAKVVQRLVYKHTDVILRQWRAHAELEQRREEERRRVKAAEQELARKQAEERAALEQQHREEEEARLRKEEEERARLSAEKQEAQAKREREQEAAKEREAARQWVEEVRGVSAVIMRARQATGRVLTCPDTGSNETGHTKTEADGEGEAGQSSLLQWRGCSQYEYPQGGAASEPGGGGCAGTGAGGTGGSRTCHLAGSANQRHLSGGEGLV